MVAAAINHNEKKEEKRETKSMTHYNCRYSSLFSVPICSNDIQYIFRGESLSSPCTVQVKFHKANDEVKARQQDCIVIVRLSLSFSFALARYCAFFNSRSIRKRVFRMTVFHRCSFFITHPVFAWPTEFPSTFI